MKFFLRALLIIGVVLSYYEVFGQVTPPQSVQAFLKIENTGQSTFDPANNVGSMASIDMEVRAIIELPDTVNVTNIHIEFTAEGQTLVDEIIGFDSISNAANFYYKREALFVTLVLGSFSGLNTYSITCKLEDSGGIVSDPVSFSN